MTSLTKEMAKELIDEARDLYQRDGELEIDGTDDPLSGISTGEDIQDMVDAGGCYVRCWRWLPLEDLSEDLYQRIAGDKNPAVEDSL